MIDRYQNKKTFLKVEFISRLSRGEIIYVNYSKNKYIFNVRFCLLCSDGDFSIDIGLEPIGVVLDRLITRNLH